MARPLIAGAFQHGVRRVPTRPLVLERLVRAR
jgi:hypothetical protein